NWNEVETWRDWISHTRPDTTANWAEEAPRIAKERGVWRWLDKLFIVVEGGKVTTLTDCPFSDEMYHYIYERYDEAGRFHVVRTNFYEDHVFTLVMTKTGRLIDIPGRPIWSPDKARFAYGVCDLLNGKDSLAILRPTGDGVTAELETTIPCGLGDCKLAWENVGALTATCLKSGDEGNAPKRVRYVRQGEKWVATTTALK
ncbi:MAG: hypothetical protein ACREUF_14490, partial [Solimonas sp.]